jgi:hypothetical protein
MLKSYPKGAYTASLAAGNSFQASSTPPDLRTLPSMLYMLHNLQHDHLQVSGWDLHCQRLANTLLRMSSTVADGRHEALLRHLTAAKPAVEALIGPSMRAATSAALSSRDCCAAWKVVILLFVRPEKGVTGCHICKQHAQHTLCLLHMPSL